MRTLYITGAIVVVASLFVLASFAYAQTDDYGDLAGTAEVAAYCPNLSVTMQRSARDASSSGQVSELQKFLSGYYDIDPEELVTGFFGRITQSYVQRFQSEQGLPSYGIVGSLTRARIASVCGNSGTGSVNFNASPISGSAPLSVQFTMTNLNQQGMGTSTYYLDFGDGSSMRTTSAVGKDTATHVYEKVGTYVATLSVAKDCPPGYGCPAVLLSLGSVRISVSSGISGAPVISGVSGPTMLQTGQSGTWTVQASDPGNGTLSYSVIWGDESSFDQISILAGSPSFVQSSTFTHAYARAGTYSPRFTVKNASDVSAYTGVSVKVSDSVGNVGFTASPTSGAAPLTVSFRTTAGDEETYTVEFGDGTSAQMSVIEGGAARGVNHTYTSAGTYTAQLVRKSGTCYINGVAASCGAPDQLMGTVFITVTGSSSGGATCPQGYYQSLGLGCLPVQTQSVPGTGATIPTCPTGYTMTLSGTCVATQPSGSTTGGGSTTVCPSGKILSILGTCI